MSILICSVLLIQPSESCNNAFDSWGTNVPFTWVFVLKTNVLWGSGNINVLQYLIRVRIALLQIKIRDFKPSIFRLPLSLIFMLSKIADLNHLEYNFIYRTMFRATGVLQRWTKVTLFFIGFSWHQIVLWILYVRKVLLWIISILYFRMTRPSPALFSVTENIRKHSPWKQKMG